LPRPPTSAPSPYTTLFRSRPGEHPRVGRVELGEEAAERRLEPCEFLGPVRIAAEARGEHRVEGEGHEHRDGHGHADGDAELAEEDRKSTRLNSSHVKISYA